MSLPAKLNPKAELQLPLVLLKDLVERRAHIALKLRKWILLLRLDRPLTPVQQTGLAGDLDSLLVSRQEIEGVFHLYRCKTCGDLRITAHLLDGNDLKHLCSRQKLEYLGRLSKLCSLHPGLETIPSPGELELLASAPYDQLIQWAHSLSLGLGDSLAGI